ncbi:MAG: tRNA (adenosine(37)-N6)-threonylcarbamoyltransferase complex ATPase subunit type 1 TsaE [Opitutaceae bacterium]|nr:tRNA (adenosine(37)-N6)-threonylcarbamoyltransferase complex ATPase subunit type 1 TsaE [Opitutaceae bacterium]
MSIFAELHAGLLAATEAETRTIAARLAAALPADRVLALSGDLGAGKTTFVKGLAAAWGVRETVTSPSFAVCNLHRGERLLVHVDAYRLDGPGSWEALMVEDFLVSPWCLAVEWPERIASILPADTLWLDLAITRDGARSIRRRA